MFLRQNNCAFLPKTRKCRIIESNLLCQGEMTNQLCCHLIIQLVLVIVTIQNKINLFCFYTKSLTGKNTMILFIWSRVYL